MFSNSWEALRSFGACGLGVLSSSYLGEQRGPDGLDVGNLGSLDQGLQLVGLYREIQCQQRSWVQCGARVAASRKCASGGFLSKFMRGGPGVRLQ